jgi:transposase-like protein
VEFINILNEYAHTDKVAYVKNTVHQNRQVACPHCCSTDIYGHGTRGHSRYQCKTYTKTFNDNTGTTLSGIKKMSEFQYFGYAQQPSYLELLIESVSIRKAAKKLDLSISNN